MSLPDECQLTSSVENLQQRVTQVESNQNITITKVSDVEARCGDLEISHQQLTVTVKQMQAEVNELKLGGGVKVKRNQRQSAGWCLNRLLYWCLVVFHPTALEGCRDIVFTHGGRMGRQ